MRIAILGTRGIPAAYGGFETFAEELSVRLARRGHEVAVYCRTPHPEPVWRGVRLRYIPPVRHKYLETVAHTFLSTLDLMRRPPEVALYCNGANALFTPLARRAGARVALNVDGLERKRKKWNALARLWYHISEGLSTFCPDVIVTDAREIQRYYRENYGAKSVFIPYGAETGKVSSRAVLDELGLEPGGYFLYVTRFEPENNPLLVRRAFERVETDLRLVLVGDAPYAEDYIRQVKDTRDPRILFPGAIYGDGYRELQSHCFAYIHATEVGGTHPALIEAMGRGALVLYLRTPENEEVAGGAGLPFEDEETLAARIREALGMPEAGRERLGRAAMRRVEQHYSWEAVTDAYERLFREMLAGGPHLG
jgi:glycosyltransferase involved in cell wall biosynthesis